MVFKALLMVLSLLSLSSLNADFYREINLLGGYSSREHFIDNSSTLKNSLGFEYFRKLTQQQGDYLTIDIQMRLLYDQEDKDHYSMQIHNLWAEYKPGLGRKLRIGHFQPVFGLENQTDSHGTILQTSAMMNIGLKHDWGIAYSRIAGRYDIAIAAQSGLGMGFPEWDNNFLFTGRIGRDYSDDLTAGISLMAGEVAVTDRMQLIPAPHVLRSIKKSRLGIDIQYSWSAFHYAGEAAYGKNDAEQVLFIFNQIDYKPFGLEGWEFNLQNHYSMLNAADWGKFNTLLGAGVSYAVSETVKLKSAALITLDQGEILDKQIFLQLYYFGR